MADSIVRLRVDSQEYDNKLKRAAEGLNRYIEGCRKAGGTLEHVDDGVKEFTQQLGKMETVAGGAKGKLGEMTKAFTDLTMQFNQMTEAEKRGQFGKALSSGLDELKQRIISTKQELADINKSLNNVGGSGGGGLFGGGKLDGMLQVFGGNLMTKGAGMLAGFASEMGDMVKQGIELARQGEGIRIAFERLNKPGLLDNLREATHGTLTNLELMKAAVQFNDFKLPLEELGTMLAFAQQKAKDTGQSVDYMAQSIVTGLGRKSVMILDNLGLSASEVKEKMAETGDMTKAVGAIIREQMAKAGDYVETAADRATQANVELENAMTRLGETFQPLSDSATSMWTDIKVGALDLLNNAIRPLIDAFTEAGRARALYENQGGNARVNRQLDRLKGIQTDSYRQGTYKAQLRNYDTQIASHEQYLKDYKAWQSDKTNVGAYDRMQAFQKQTGMKWVSDVQAHLDAFKKMRAEYQQGAKSILSPVKANIDTSDAEQNIASLTKKLKDLQAERKKAIAAGDKQKSADLLKQINQTKADIKGLRGSTSTTTTKQPKTEVELNQAKIKDLTQEYIKLGDQETEASKNRQIEIQKEIELLQKRNNLLGVRAEQAQGKFLGGDVQTTGLSPAGYIIDRSRLFDTEGGIGWQKLQKYNDQTSVSEYKRRQKEYVKNNDKEGKGETKSVSEEMSKITMSVSGIFNGIEQLGIELPQGLKDVLGGIQTVAGILTAISSLVTIITALQSAKSVPIIGWALANGGVVHAADGYQVPGNRMSGDQVPAMLNSGELVLNKAQQGNLASQLEGGVGAMQLSAIITGEQLRLVLNNNGRRTGRGEYVTTNFR